MPQASRANLRFIEKHVQLSVRVCANITPYEKAKCYVCTGGEYMHVKTMVTEILPYMNEISDHIYNLLLQWFQPTFQSLNAKIEEDIVQENNPAKDNLALPKVQAALVK